jgi:hypothetical protein
MGLDPPPAWQPLWGMVSLDRILGEPGTKLENARLIDVGGVSVSSSGGGLGVYISLPADLAKTEIRSHTMSGWDFCRWVVPQLEYAPLGRMPDLYKDGEWCFDKLSGE